MPMQLSVCLLTPFTLPKPVGILGEIEQHTHIY
jgi:hypothetical protein